MKIDSLSIRRQDGALQILDQTLLPLEERWLTVPDAATMITHIQRLAVRGAPLIGVAAALALAEEASGDISREALRARANELRAARPTAVNLMHAMDRMIAKLDGGLAAIRAEAEAIYAEDVRLCLEMANRAAAFIHDGDGLLTHCNTGGLATAGVGTALGAIRAAWMSGKKIHVFVDETRPLLQGARLTAWELGKLGIPHTLICDSMAANLMRAGRVQHVLVGADRIALNGDVANKVGTYGLAVQAKHHGVPFTVVAPSTTLDPACLTGAEIPIEERNPEEVRGGRAPLATPVWNPAFDVAPRALITRIVLEDREF
ncbi:MAG: S-methyl-5-thioribose-1-phosphate isomerase [Proteobacteria bacterium]|nr:MAG: S-methyl-5-thioribose-1-phosphate isomerase [Pseudomonadota bacterium]